MLLCECDHCDKRFHVNDEFAGKRIRCPQCREVVAVPVSPESSNSEQSAVTRPATHKRPHTTPATRAPANELLTHAPAVQRSTASDVESSSAKKSEIITVPTGHRRWVSVIVIAALVASPFLPEFSSWLGIAILGLCCGAFVQSAADRGHLTSKTSAATPRHTIGSRMLSILPAVQNLSRRMLRLDNDFRWMSRIRFAIYCVLGGILVVAGHAGSVSQAEQKIAAAKHAAQEAEKQQAIDEANSKVASLVREAEEAINRGEFSLAASLLSSSSKIPNATDASLVRAANTRLADAQVKELVAKAVNALRTGDLAMGKKKIQEALSVPNASNLEDVAKLERVISDSTDPIRIREAMVSLPDEMFLELGQSRMLPASMISGYQSLDTRATELALAAIDEVADLREKQRLIRIEEERKQQEKIRLASEESARKAESNKMKEEEARLAATASSEKRERKSVQRGGTGYLEVEGESEVWVSVDEDAFDELNSFSSAKNVEAIMQMMEQGRVLVCAKQTRVSVVDPGFFSTTIRIMEGKHSGSKGVVPNEFLHAEPPGVPGKNARTSDGGKKKSPASKDRAPSANTVTVRSSKLVDFVSPATGQKMLMLIVTLKNNGTTPVRVVDADITWSDSAGNVIDTRNYTICAEFDSQPGIAPGGTWTTRKGEGFIIAYGPGIGEKAKTVKVKITKVREHSEM